MAVTVKIEAFSFLLRRIYFESERLGMQPLSLAVVDAVVQYYSVGSPVWNHLFRTLMVCLALSIHIVYF